MPNIRGAWLNQLREDVVNATLISILPTNGLPSKPQRPPPPAKAGIASPPPPLRLSKHSRPDPAAQRKSS
jgi:hypothetical protein